MMVPLHSVLKSSFSDALTDEKHSGISAEYQRDYFEIINGSFIVIFYFDKYSFSLDTF